MTHAAGGRRSLWSLPLLLLVVAASAVGGDALPWSDERGSGEPAIVFLHGLGADSNVWDRVAPRLAAHHRVVIVDLPGHGGSPPIREVTVRDVARDVDRVLEARGIRGAVIVGHSYGAWVALEEAVARPKRVAAVVALDIGTYTPTDTAHIAMLERHLTERYRSLVRVIFENMTIDPVEADSAMAQALRMPPEVLAAYLRDSWHMDMRRRIRNLKIPVHVIATAGTWPASQSWEAARERVGYVTKGPVIGHRVDGSGHLIMRDRPDTLFTILENIVEGVAR